MTGFGTVVANQDPTLRYHVCIRHIVPRDSDLKRLILSEAIIQLSFTAYVRRTVDPVQHQICYQDRQLRSSQLPQSKGNILGASPENRIANDLDLLRKIMRNLP